MLYTNLGGLRLPFRCQALNNTPVISIPLDDSTDLRKLDESPVMRVILVESFHLECIGDLEDYCSRR